MYIKLFWIYASIIISLLIVAFYIIKGLYTAGEKFLEVVKFTEQRNGKMFLICLYILLGFVMVGLIMFSWLFLALPVIFLYGMWESRHEVYLIWKGWRRSSSVVG